MEAVNYGAGDGPNSIFAADLDSDGDSDLATANKNSDDISILLNLSNPIRPPDEEPEIPDQFSIFSYPNPFNASTTIQFSLIEKSEVTINIYDLLGRMVETLVKAEKPAGIF
jgi:hypothetical protein